MGVTVICKTCGKEFSTIRCRENISKYCSRECADKGRRTGYTLICAECGKEFTVQKCRADTAKFCSRACADRAKIAKPNVTCCVCGKKFHKKPSHIGKSEKDYCSYKCHYEDKKIRMSGENNHQYGLKGDLNASFKSDFSISGYGYLMVRTPNHPFRGKVSDCIFYHRAMVEEYLRSCEPASEYLIEVDGCKERYLDPQVCIHHIDGNKLNNKIDNLRIMEYGDHVALHSEDHVTQRDEFGKFVNNITIKEQTDYTSISKGKTYDAGHDLHAKGEYTIYPNEACLISTGLKMAIPKGNVGFIWSRSGLAVKNNIECGAGCIDSEYRGEIKVLLRNFGERSFEINSGDRIAQIVVLPVKLSSPVDGVLPQSDGRGSDGFGSSGVKHFDGNKNRGSDGSTDK